MRKLLYTGLVIILVAVVVLFSQDDKRDTDTAVNKLLNLDSDSALVINLPESQAAGTNAPVGVMLTDVTVTEGSNVQNGTLSGQYQNDAERGSVTLDYLHLTAVAIPKSTDYSYFVAPFSVSNQGSGVFYYLALLARNDSQQTLVHVASYYLGDRIVITEVTDFGDKVTVDFNSHSADSSFAEPAAQAQEVTLQVDVTAPALRVYQGMHPSWDADQDGINDCEADGNCDHSVDYNLPK